MFLSHVKCNWIAIKLSGNEKSPFSKVLIQNFVCGKQITSHFLNYHYLFGLLIIRWNMVIRNKISVKRFDKIVRLKNEFTAFLRYRGSYTSGHFI